MGILKFLKPPPYTDATLGALTRRGGRWQGKIILSPEGDAPLLLAGGRTAPNEAGLKLARELVPRYADLRSVIALALLEHYQPWREALDADGTEALGDVPWLEDAGQVWSHVSLVRVLIEPLGRIDTVEIAYRADWDEEHTLGARFQGWALVELNGSVI
jgi:hypothetical protein